MNNKKAVSASPHIRHKTTTASIMTDVAIALLPALVSGVYYFGFRVAYLTLLSVLFCVGFEFLWQKITKKEVTINDGTAVVTGLLLAFNLPVSVPWWLILVGAFVAIIIAKQLFGGVGNNFINPALAGRAFLMASWPALMTHWIPPFSGNLKGADVVSTATPLAILKDASIGTLPPLSDMFMGNIGGCIGETCALALLVGGAYLVLRGVISLRIPLVYILTVAVLTFVFPNSSLSRIDSVLYNVLGGSLLLGAIFMATDYVTSPITKKGQVIMGLGCGILTFVIRRFGGYPEGASYSIMLMNVATPLIDQWVRPRTFGTPQGRGGR